ncbi:hypothetical protein C7M84_014026 [Penaeus vannamei]|uniref:Uncharacterized protein n=1 Tax=Penaeus vannamei TaxID=6689 RepID=A0A3R7LYC8_PENVA|nr:hypothetical protein C7M84_014026 [Penaeus vannamei]
MTDEDVVTMDYETVKEAAVEDADYQRLIARGRTGDWPASKCKEFIGLRPYYQNFQDDKGSDQIPQRIELRWNARRDSELKRFVKTNFLIVNPKEELVYDLRKVLRDCIVEISAMTGW